VLIVSNFELDAAQTIRALTAESRRRGLALPARLETPDPTWLDGYRVAARDTSLLSELHELHAALIAAGACLDPLLARKITTGVWEPQERRWRGSVRTVSLHLNDGLRCGPPRRAWRFTPRLSSVRARPGPRICAQG
jgi:hypothetical protein